MKVNNNNNNIDKKEKNSIIYIRTSTKEQTPELQLRDISSLVDINDCEILTDKQSAWKDNVERTSFNKLIDMIKQKEVSLIYIWDLDRLYRDRKKLLQFFELCKMYECSIYSYRQKFLTEIQQVNLPDNFSFIKEMMVNNFIQFLGWIAEEESLKKSERIKNAVKKKGDRTISYKGNIWGRKSLPKQTKDRIIKLYLEGKSIRKIAEEVKTTDKNKNQKNVSRSAVHKTIQKYLQEKGSNNRVSITN
jgi:DNA invertase Pin-like site-specific DNA recombinase